MLVGAQKAATTSLHARLAARADYCEAPAGAGEPAHYAKEKHFFDVPERCAKGVEWYRGRFPARSSRCAFHVDATPLIAGTGWRDLLVAPGVLYTVPPPLAPAAQQVESGADPLSGQRPMCPPGAPGAARPAPAAPRAWR